MGQNIKTKLIILIICFGLTSILIYDDPYPEKKHKTAPLSQALLIIPGWHMIKSTSLDPKVTEVLKLDDYLNATYYDGKKSVGLYVGYYLTTKKVGAAHDPMVCFPGQGWQISNSDSSKLKINVDASGFLSYSTIIGELNNQKMFILYWFQSWDRSNPGTVSQKIWSFLNRLLNKGEDNAFVRITIDLNDTTNQEAKKTALKFMQSFYPVFIDYLKQK